MKTKTECTELYEMMTFGDRRLIEFEAEADGSVCLRVSYPCLMFCLERWEAIEVIEMVLHVTLGHESQKMRMVDGSIFSVSRFSDSKLIWINGWSRVYPGQGWFNNPCGSIQLTNEEAKCFTERLLGVIDAEHE